MDPKPSRIARRVPVVAPSPLAASSSGTRRLYESRENGLPDSFGTRDTSKKLEAEFQSTRLHQNSHQDFNISDSEHSEHLLKLSAAASTHSSRAYERPWSVGLSGSRGRMSSTTETCCLSTPLPLPSSLYNETERLPGTSTRLTQSQISDSKRPKLASTCPPSNSNNCLSNNPDSVWRCSQFPRSSTLQFSSASTTGSINEGIEMERPKSSVGDCSYRNSSSSSSSSSSSYLQERFLSSYAQGARPRDTLFGSLRRTATSLNHPTLSTPLETQSTFSKDSSRSSPRSSGGGSSFREVETPQTSIECDFMHGRTRPRVLESGTSERRNASLLQQRQPNSSTESGSRCRPRQLLSRLASSVTSTFSGTRRSNQEHSNARSFETRHSFGQSDAVLLDGRPQNSSQIGSAGRAVNTDISHNRSSESSQGFGFLRWRRTASTSTSQSQNFDAGRESSMSSRPDDLEDRSTASWLSSSLRNRCTPLFSRRRREGRNEFARMAVASSTNDTRTDRSPILQREVRMFGDLSRQPPIFAQGAAAAVSSPLASPAASNISSASSPADSGLGASPNRINSGIARIFPNSVIRLSMPFDLGDGLTDNVMIAVDFTRPSRNPVESQQQEKQKKETVSSRDPEKLRQIQESLLLEDSDEDEGDLCRICQIGTSSSSNPLIQPCNCNGSLQYVHQECVKKWLQSKINSGADLTAVTICELCKEKLQLDFEDFDVHELYRAHAVEQAQYDFISSGLYLVLLLHLCEQRFSDMMGGTSETRTRLRFIHLARTLQQHIQDLETTDEDSEDEQDSSDNSGTLGGST
ncbi:E3 ubiquitin-protein ligase MARCH7 [Callorhinchus milii]|uniref:RING-type E3 ubiquitin transferase n=1 Tax=Callorhinchus milii TaxID=7868 RepID=A0A4W3H9R7_CALMI|nr:E3 ubiquitin-protein ligase MARCH7 [Callorhinchus milii]XP_007888012.1 E3 ubiquitin-protein ligase MARCH7 [Callorhinchus milii]XP_007888013.1 E3 ubiquitin-protein ligase MARCH7 [Callorhinchus milii]XP_007888014.1 E3 ubiquitin-protein ligase MARCH7 [Callorhinchus milii]XP_042192260.1 E3 ubiquitin-protein ligase MARCH7 [Callorhinchus milii]XP_042192261.1 E3 ubiquitin-protein ligase MARCH7 [Callorhinchus milii]XP_042192262.1 E3 ubiquitin-protein ligase MARCH7 [Callorhinchus milii]|eukprot:gi/632945341/ref/XP_007888011.1/ PREDICTED: E3 ubiquitin-protein ligase MARCH7 [Callorhinchus milii]